MQLKPIKKKIKYTCIYAFIQFLFWMADVFPRTWILAIYKQLGKISFHLFKGERKNIKKNLNFAFDADLSEKEAEDFSKKLFTNIAQNVGDIFIARSYQVQQELDRWVDFEGLHHLTEAYEKGNGVIAITCHMGAFELIGSILSFRYPTNIIGKKLHNPKLDSLVVDYRTSHGAKILYSGEGMLKIVRALHRGEVVAILIDQDIPKMKGVFVDFFGKPAYTPTGAAWLAQHTDAAVVPMAIRRTENNRQCFTVMPEIAVKNTGNSESDICCNTQNFTCALEQLIRQDLTQWVWMHKRWKTQPKDVLI